MLDILIYVFETYFRSHEGIRFERDKLTDSLKQAGFEGEQIGEALAWLEELKQERSAMVPDAMPQGVASRVYQRHEVTKIGINNINTLIRLENFCILNAKSRELVIDRLMALPEERLAAHQVKCVVLLVLFSDPDGAKALSAMEYLVMKDDEEMSVH
jgi:Smg protein